MYSGTLNRAVLAIGFSMLLPAGEIEGDVIIKRKLTRRTVTAAAGLYQRGPSVVPPPSVEEDPLVYERSRVVVWIDANLPSQPVAAVMEQENRRFVPDLLVVPEGSTISFPNRDTIFHNVFSLSKTKTFDLGTYPKDRTRTVTLSNAGILYVNCHLHPSMSAVIVVAPNGHFTRPDAAGHFRLQDVPDGRHTVVAWHKAAGFFRQTVDLDSGRPASVSFLIPFDDKEPAGEPCHKQ